MISRTTLDGAGLWLWHTLGRNARLASHRGVLALHGSGWRDENGRNWIRWCFVDPKLAEAFAAEFAAFTVKK